MHVRRWIDRSGQQNHAYADGPQRPEIRRDAQNGLSVLNFNGGQHRLAIADESDFDAVDALTIFIVFNSDGYSRSYEALLTKGEGAWRIHRQRNEDFIAYHVNSGTTEANAISSTNTSNTGFHLVNAHTAGSVHSLFLNGVLEGQQTLEGPMNQNDSQVNLGSNPDADDRQWNGQIGEVLVYISSLPEEDRERIEAYLMYKWGL